MKLLPSKKRDKKEGEIDHHLQIILSKGGSSILLLSDLTVDHNSSSVKCDIGNGEIGYWNLLHTLSIVSSRGELCVLGGD